MLKKIYSNTNLIESVIFKPGLNIIMGIYSTDQDNNGINGIGKSTLIRLVGYCLINSKSEKTFNQSKYDFLRIDNHNILLDFEISGKEYTIERDFNKPNSIFFGESSKSTLEEYSKSEIKTILGDLFFPAGQTNVTYKGNRYGTLMDFFVKDDLQNQTRIDPLNFLSYSASQGERYLYNLYLLGIPNHKLIDYLSTNDLIKNISNTIKSLKDKIKLDTGKSIEEYRTEKLKIENNISLLKRSIKEYNFFDVNKKIEEELCLVIERLNNLLSKYHQEKIQLEKIRQSYNTDVDFDIDKIKKIYNEAVTYLGNFVAKTLEDVIEFKKSILDNRNKHLQKAEEDLLKIIEDTLADIKKEEKKRSKLFSQIKEKGSLDKIEKTYEQLLEEKTSLEKNTAIINEVDSFTEQISDKEVYLAQLKRDVTNDIRSVEAEIDKLRLLFQDILKNVMDTEDENSFFDITICDGNRKNQLPFKILVEIPKADALGQERLKIVAYDLMTFIKNRENNRQNPDFLIHDGVFHAISNKTLLDVLNYIQSKSNKLQNFQYIVTFNEDEITSSTNSMYGNLNFELENSIIVKYSDTTESMIFKKIF